MCELPIVLKIWVIYGDLVMCLCVTGAEIVLLELLLLGFFFLEVLLVLELVLELLLLEFFLLEVLLVLELVLELLLLNFFFFGV